MTPSPKRAKSYLTGSIGSNSLKVVSNSNTALASFCFLANRPSLRAVFPE